jgi:hypothetical protein
MYLFDASHLALSSITSSFSSQQVRSSSSHHYWNGILPIHFTLAQKKKASLDYRSAVDLRDEDKRCVKKAKEIFKLDKHKLCWIRVKKEREEKRWEIQWVPPDDKSITLCKYYFDMVILTGHLGCWWYDRSLD